MDTTHGPSVDVILQMRSRWPQIGCAWEWNVRQRFFGVGYIAVNRARDLNGETRGIWRRPLRKGASALFEDGRANSLCAVYTVARQKMHMGIQLLPDYTKDLRRQKVFWFLVTGRWWSFCESEVCVQVALILLCTCFPNSGKDQEAQYTGW